MHVIVRSDKVRIPTGHGAVSCMEFGAHFMRRRYPHVVGEECVHGAAQLGRAPLVRHSYTDRLPARVKITIGIKDPGSTKEIKYSFQTLLFMQEKLDFSK